MNERSILNQKLYRAKEALKAVIDRMLEINKEKRQHTNRTSKDSIWREELRFLNRIAAMQDRLIRNYEMQLSFM